MILSILRTENLTYLYSAGTPFETFALNNVNIDIDEGTIVAVIGHTGSGKSTLIQHFNGLLEPHAGKVFVEEKDIFANKKDIRAVRFNVGLCFQYPEYQLFEETVFKEIAFGPKQMGLDDETVKERVLSACSFVGIKEKHLEKSPFDLSGGQKRRVAIASILAMQPKILVLDEPTAGLDPKGRETILSLIKNYQSAMKSTVILVSHSMEDVARIADKVIVMNDSKMALSGTVHEVYSHADELRSMGLNVPDITTIFSKLKQNGVDCSNAIYTVDAAVEEIKRLIAQKGGKRND